MLLYVEVNDLLLSRDDNDLVPYDIGGAIWSQG